MCKTGAVQVCTGQSTCIRDKCSTSWKEERLLAVWFHITQVKLYIPCIQYQINPMLNLSKRSYEWPSPLNIFPYFSPQQYRVFVGPFPDPRKGIYFCTEDPWPSSSLATKRRVIRLSAASASSWLSTSWLINYMCLFYTRLSPPCESIVSY